MSVITKAMIKQAKTIYVFATFTGDDESWVKISRQEALHHLARVPTMRGDEQKETGALFLSR